MGIYSNLSQEAVAKNKLDRSMILFSINHKKISNLINYRFQLYALPINFGRYRPVENRIVLLLHLHRHRHKHLVFWAII